MAKISWLEFLASAGARTEESGHLVFGSEIVESRLARDATVVSPLTHLSVVGFSGDDAKTYLHNLFTSDVEGLGADASQYSAWCSPQGRMLANFILYRDQGAYHALLSADLLATTIKRLRMYVLRSKVELSDESDAIALFGVSGPDAPEVLRAAALPVPLTGTAKFDGGTLIRIEDRRYIAAIQADAARGVWKKLAGKATPVGVPAWRWLDIRAGIPWITQATEEKFVPQMLGFEKIGGVSFTKGCYPGQEVVARSQYLGRLKRHLYRLHTEASARAGEPVYSAEAACGTLVCAAPSPEGGFDALGVLLDEAAQAGGIRSESGQLFDSVEALEI
ncbi:MAG: folate-binding protein YgfZ [Candidatus Accumulibacter sp.]|jgi:folate-binding protein YgfZ|nr:folate-binding protein YgfZ [Accumulibacter sp.]